MNELFNVRVFRKQFGEYNSYILVISECLGVMGCFKDGGELESVKSRIMSSDYYDGTAHSVFSTVHKYNFEELRPLRDTPLCEIRNSLMELCPEEFV